MTVHVSIGGTEYAQVVRDSIVVTENLGRPSSASFRLEDMTSSLALAGWFPDTLAAVRIWDDREAGNLFWGQLTDFRASVEGVRRVIEIEAEGYDRLLDWTLVGTGLVGYRNIIWDGDEGDSLHARWGEWFWADPYADTGIAYPARDDATIVQALIEHYWTGPTLTFDITGYGDVDAGTYPSSPIDYPSIEGRTYFGQTTLRDALDRVASLISRYLVFWIDADLVFHWKTLPPATWATTSFPDGSNLHGLARILPEWRTAGVEFTPYSAIEDDPSALRGRLGIEFVHGSAVDRAFVQAGSEAASGWSGYFRTGTGAATFVSAPWVIAEGDLAAGLAYAAEETGPRQTFTLDVLGDWLGLHAGQVLTIYSPSLGINTAVSQVLQTASLAIGPESERTYSLQAGDSAVRTMSAYAAKASPRKEQRDESRKPKVFGMAQGARFDVNVEDVSVKAGTHQRVVAQYVDTAGAALPHQGLKVYWGMVIKSGTAEDLTVGSGAVTRTDLMFHLGSETGMTNAAGRVENTLYVNANATTTDAVVVTASLTLV